MLDVSMIVSRVAALRASLHKHRYMPTLWNRYGMYVEQQCRCGAAQHHFAIDLDWSGTGPDIRWRDGRHPNRPKET